MTKLNASNESIVDSLMVIFEVNVSPKLPPKQVKSVRETYAKVIANSEVTGQLAEMLRISGSAESRRSSMERDSAVGSPSQAGDVSEDAFVDLLRTQGHTVSSKRAIPTTGQVIADLVALAVGCYVGGPAVLATGLTIALSFAVEALFVTEKDDRIVLIKIQEHADSHGGEWPTFDDLVAGLKETPIREFGRTDEGIRSRLRTCLDNLELKNIINKNVDEEKITYQVAR